jgi:adenylate cyclase
MRTFDFAPRSADAPFRDVADVLESLERAKTALRTLGKFAPVDLVKHLYRGNEEARLGGALADVTLMFTDIESFTSLAERITPMDLAAALGLYFETMARAVRSTGGTIDKFIGDAVMAIWNAPSPVERHAAQACRAVLACVEATRELYASQAWAGLPPLVTRFGVHTDRVLVGLFGAPERMSFTALGDGVNLASRLEALGKHYGVTRLVSEAVVDSVGGEFAFRRIDKVAVKGKSKAVTVYELLEQAADALDPAVRAYEQALDDYWAHRFSEARAALDPHLVSDGPCRVLAARCQTLIDEAPPPNWDGTFVARSK